MDIIKLKDCTVTNIDSDITKYEARYYYEVDETIQRITVTFSDGESVDFDFYEYKGVFGNVIGFFYGKDFSNITKERFIQMFVKEFQCECSLYDTNDWARAVHGDWDENE